MIPLAALAIFSGLSFNLLINFALGAASLISPSGIAAKGTGDRKNENHGRLPLYQLGVLFLSVLIIWGFFSWLLPPSVLGFLEYFLFFPVSALVCMGFELLGDRIFAKNGFKKVFSALTAYDGLVPASLIITFMLGENFAGVFILTLFFTLGNLFSILVLNEIRRRSAFEWVPRYLRGSPLHLISMGLLSMIAAQAAVICFKILETY